MLFRIQEFQKQISTFATDNNSYKLDHSLFVSNLLYNAILIYCLDKFVHLLLTILTTLDSQGVIVEQVYKYGWRVLVCKSIVKVLNKEFGFFIPTQLTFIS